MSELAARDFSSLTLCEYCGAQLALFEYDPFASGKRMKQQTIVAHQAARINGLVFVLVNTTHKSKHKSLSHHMIVEKMGVLTMQETRYTLSRLRDLAYSERSAMDVVAQEVAFAVGSAPALRLYGIDRRRRR